MVPAWISLLARGVLALALGLVIALTLDHSPAFGLVAFGVFALLAGAALAVAVLRDPATPRRAPLLLAAAGAFVVAGVSALALSTGGVLALALVVGVWALVAGALEAVHGIRHRGSSPLARDAVITGVLTLALGVVVLLIPRDLTQQFSGSNGIAGVLTAPVVIVGVLGAWAVLVGVQQVIAALSLRFVGRTVSA